MFNNAKFFEDVQKTHLKPRETLVYDRISDSEVREKLNDFVDCGNHPRFSKALDGICTNLVGRTMFKLLITKMIARRITKNIRIIEEHEEGSGYSSEDFAVYINLNFYEKNGSGIPSRQYYCIDDDGQIDAKLKSLAGSMFHEFCHALHDVSGTDIADDSNAICVRAELWNVWSVDEELRTITCFAHDPICDHCFDFVQSNTKGEAFRPRYGHRGYIEGDHFENTKNRRELFIYLSESKIFMDGWKEYMV
jgi:hypothetical protein